MFRFSVQTARNERQVSNFLNQHLVNAICFLTSQPTFSSSVSQEASQSLGFSSGGNPAATASNAASPKAEAPRATPSNPLRVLLPPPIKKSSAALHCAALLPEAALQQHDTSELSALLLNAPPPRSHAVEAAACLGPVDKRYIHQARTSELRWQGKK